MRRIYEVAGTLVLSILIGCGGSGSAGGSGPAGVNGSKQVSTVTDSEKGILCDWYVGMIGGYGTPSDSICGAALITAPPDKATCQMDFPVCTVTVAQFEDCVTRLVAAQDACTQAAMDEASAAPSCQAVGLAGCFN